MSLQAKLAILVDGENFPPGALARAEEVLSGYRLEIRRVYGDWARSDLGPWRSVAEARGFRLVQVTRLIQGKSSVDQGITIDAMDILHAGKVDGICLLTNDTDFVPLLTRLREGHLKVVLVGDTRAPQGLRLAAHEFHEIAVSAATVAPKTGGPRDAWDIIDAAYVATERAGKSNLAALGAELKKMHPEFTPKTYGAKKLIDLILALPSYELVREPSETESTGQYVRRLQPIWAPK